MPLIVASNLSFVSRRSCCFQIQLWLIWNWSDRDLPGSPREADQSGFLQGIDAKPLKPPLVWCLCVCLAACLPLSLSLCVCFWCLYLSISLPVSLC
jgi:hypothetical protein